MDKDSLSLSFALPFLYAGPHSWGVYVTENLEHTTLGVAREPLTIYYSCRWDWTFWQRDIFFFKW